MQTAEVQDLLKRLRAGRYDPGDTSYLESVKASELIAALSASFPVRFQDRRLKEKWEIGLSRCVEYRLVPMRIRGSAFVAFDTAPVLIRCIFLSGEGETVTGVSVVGRITIRRARNPAGLTLRTTSGYKLVLFPDGWEGQPMAAKPAHFTEDFLRQRGWVFGVFRPITR